MNTWKDSGHRCVANDDPAIMRMGVYYVDIKGILFSRKTGECHITKKVDDFFV